jgi:hypothetical protein
MWYKLQKAPTEPKKLEPLEEENWLKNKELMINSGTKRTFISKAKP